MIKLDVQEYCHECPFFEAEVKGGATELVSTTGEHILFPGDTIISCKSADRCHLVVMKAIGRMEEKT